MASFKIHDDQENRRPDILAVKDVGKNVLLQNRTVLGVIDRNAKKFTANLKQNAQPLKKQDENAYAKQPSRKPIPAVPVAQFEAFKVYEDKPEEQRPTGTAKLAEQKKIDTVFNFNARNKCEEKKDVEEDNNKLVEKSALAETTANLALSPMSDDGEAGCPMSVDKSLIVCKNPNRSITVRPEREIFYEMPEYREDIYKHLREAELRNRPKPGYMKKQPDITYPMRTILVDWLVEVAEEYRLQTETLYLAVSYIDRFLSYMSVVRAKLQLVGTAAMFLASKYEEIYPPDVGEFVYITDDTYNKKQVIRMEQLILKVLNFDVSIPTPLTFIQKFCAWNDQPERVQFLALYLCELSMLEADPYLQFLPSMLAASGIYLARQTLELEAWPIEIEKKLGYSVRQMQNCITHLYNTFLTAANLQQQAINEKYKSTKYQHVSMILPRSNTEEKKDEEENTNNSEKSEIRHLNN